MNLNAIPRRNPHLNEAIEFLDQYYIRAGQDTKKALSMLSAREEAFVDAEMEHCITDACYYLENYHVIQPIEGKMQTLMFLDSQQMIYDKVVAIQRAGRPVKLVVLKARQIGSSTLSEGLIFHKTIFTRGCNTLIVAQDPATASALFEMSRLAFDRMPWWMRPEARYDAKGKYMVFDKKDDMERQMRPGMRSAIIVESANKLTQAGRGKTFLAVHLCLSDQNPVILADSHIKSIADVQPGDFIRSDKGFVSVKSVAINQAELLYTGAEYGYKITSWCNAAFPIEGTGNHRVMVAEMDGKYRKSTKIVNRRMMELSELKAGKDSSRGHCLVVPIRPITNDGDQRLLSDGMSVGYRKHGGGKQSRWSPPSLSSGDVRELGFAVGLYLAEGSWGPGRIDVSLDLDEVEYADRFAAAVGINYGRVSRSKDSRTCIYHFYNSAFAKWMLETFGKTDEKRIPDFCWTLGRGFLEGVVEGMICGDGHVPDKYETVYFTSTRVQLSLGLREAVASLGFGYGGIYFREAGRWYDRNCQASWILCFGDACSMAMRDAYGWPQNSKTNKTRGRHWMYSEDKTEIYVSIRKVERVTLEIVYDIEVESEEHVFLLPAAITHNSELSSWPDGGLLSKSLFPTMHAQDELAFMESTALGRQGFWYEWWKGVESGEISDWEPVFIPYYTIKKYSKPIPETIRFKLTEEETRIREKVKESEGVIVSNENFNWVRMKKQEFIRLEGDEFGFYGEYPANPTEAFQTSGICAFPKRLLQRVLESTACKPRWFGEIYYKPGANRSNIRLYDPVDQKYDQLHRVYKGERIPPAKEEGERFRVWEMPEPGFEYYAGVDVAMGDGGDFSCVQVFKVGRGQQPDVQVAEWRGWINPTDLALVSAAIGYFYNTCEIAIEVNNEGAVTNNHIFRVLEYPELYRWKYIDKISNFITPYFGWYTNSKTRPYIIVKMREALMEKTVILRSEDLVDEMMAFTREEDEEKFTGRGTNDDRVMAAMIARYCAHEFDYADDSNSKAGKASVSVNQTFYIFDEQHRLRFQSDDRELVERQVAAHPGWSFSEEPQRKNKANTDFSPIHDDSGIQSQLYQLGIPAEQIPPDVAADLEVFGSLRSGRPEDQDDWRAM